MSNKYNPLDDSRYTLYFNGETSKCYHICRGDQIGDEPRFLYMYPDGSWIKCTWKDKSTVVEKGETK